jgi:apolipoprotein N-acyltransferase
MPEALFAAMLGALAGVTYGVPGCGWALPPIVTALAWRLAAPGAAPRHAAMRLGLFTAGWCVAAVTPATLALPSDWRALGWTALVLLAAAHAAGAALAGWLAFAWRVSPGLRMAIVLPSVWTIVEALSGYGTAAMPWMRLGLAQASGGPLAGALPYGGVLWASWLTVSVAGLSALALRGSTRCKRCAPAAIAAGMVLLVAAMGQARWTQPLAATRIALLQPGLSLSSRAMDDASVGRLLAWYARRLEEASAQLVVTPQLALPKTAPALPAGYLPQLDAALRARGADALIGLHIPHDLAPTLFNRMLFNGVLVIGASASSTDPPPSYRKHRLFPFGEFLPLPALQALLPAPWVETARGAAADAPVLAGGQRLALALCWEAAFGDAWRPTAATAAMLVNLTGDGTFVSAALARQWRQVAQARAREFQKPFVRTSDVGGSFVVDHGGRIVDALPDGSEGVLRTTVQPRAGLTPYARWGDMLVCLWIAVALGVATLAGAVRSRPAIAMGPVPARRVAGQVVPAASVALLVIGAMFYLMVETGQAVQEKIRVTIAADAAAYSAAVVEARALNYDALVNRAIVANEMAIAEMVSFASWLRYFATASDNFAANVTDINAFVLPNPDVARLDVAFGGSAAVAAYLGGRRAEDVADNVIAGIGALITAHDLAARTLALSQHAVHLHLTAGLRQQQIAQRVVQAMDPALRAEVLPASHGFDAFTRTYARSGPGGDERGRLADVITRSRDAFTRERNWTVSSFDIPFVRQDGALKKRGGTELIGFDEWRAVDTLELHGRTWGCGKFGLDWCDDIRRPIGWGAVAVSNDGADHGRGVHGNAYADNPTTAARAEADLRFTSTATFTGLPDTRDMADLDPSHAAVTGLTVHVAKPLSATHLSGQAAQAQGSGRLALFAPDAGTHQIAALSRAEVFFDRIVARADDKVELGSLYNPYWRVRLVAPTTGDRVEAAARHGGLGLP